MDALFPMGVMFRSTGGSYLHLLGLADCRAVHEDTFSKRPTVVVIRISHRSDACQRRLGRRSSLGDMRKRRFPCDRGEHGMCIGAPPKSTKRRIVRGLGGAGTGGKPGSPNSSPPSAANTGMNYNDVWFDRRLDSWGIVVFAVRGCLTPDGRHRPANSKGLTSRLASHTPMMFIFGDSCSWRSR